MARLFLFWQVSYLHTKLIFGQGWGWHNRSLPPWWITHSIYLKTRKTDVLTQTNIMLQRLIGRSHYSDVIMGAMASQITSLTIVYPAVYSGADQTKHQSSMQLLTIPHKGPVISEIVSIFMMTSSMETFPALLAICAGNSLVTGEFPSQRPMTRSFGIFFDLRQNKRLSKWWWCWWFETPSRPVWRHYNDYSANQSGHGGNWIYLYRKHSYRP